MHIKSKRGITLIALVITIIVLLILAGVSLSITIGDNGILNKATDAKINSDFASEIESIRLAYIKYEDYKDSELDLKLDVPGAVITGNEDDGWEIVFDDTTDNQYILLGDGSISEPFNIVEWNKNAASEDCFIWKSNDPTSEDYGTVMGYTPKVQNYTKLRYPSRCKKIIMATAEDTGDYESAMAMRAYVNNIENVELPNTVKIIDQYAFYNYGFKNIKKINIPLSVTKIGGMIFIDCVNLTNIEIPSSVTSIGGDAFLRCTNLKNITIPNSITSIGPGAFTSCTNLNNIKIPNNITKIESRTFSGCSSLSSFIIPSNVNIIDDHAFANCTSLNSITIPSNVKTIKENAFYGWTSSQTINIEAESQPEYWDSNWNYGCDANIVWGYTGN